MKLFKNSKTAPLIASPYLAWAVIFILVPLAMVFYYGLTDDQGGFTFENVATIAEYGYFKALIKSVKLALISTAICLVLAYPLGMVYNFLPFMILPIYNALSRIDDNVINAARDLGAGTFQTFLRIIFPLSLPGIISGITMVFIPALTTFAISSMLGGSKILLIGNIIEQQFTQLYDWHLGSGLSIVLMIFIILNMIVENITDTEGGTLA